MKGFRRIIVFLLCCLLAVQLGPLSAFADESGPHDPSNGIIDIPDRDVEYYKKHFPEIYVDTQEDSARVFANDIAEKKLQEDGSIRLSADSELVFEGDGYYQNELMVYTVPYVKDDEINDILKPLDSIQLLIVTGFDEIGLCFSIKVEDGISAENVAKIIQEDRRVETVELRGFFALEDEIMSVEDGQVLEDGTVVDLNPDISYPESIASFKPSERSSQVVNLYPWWLNNIKAPDAWPFLPTGSTSDRIVVIDTGVNKDHPALSGVLDMQNSYDATINATGQAVDDYGHGTAVASLISSGFVANGLVYRGSSNGMKIISVKAGLYDPFFGNAFFSLDHLYRAYDKIIKMANYVPIKVVNMSYGSVVYDATAENYMETMYGKGITLVSAAGNYIPQHPDDNGRTVLAYPASYEGVISVSNTMFNNELSPDSMYGTAVDLAAPGTSIYVPWLEGYLLTRGTSLSSPLVAGVAGLLYWQNPGITNVRVEEILKYSAQDLYTPGRDDFTGYGLVNAYTALSPDFTDLVRLRGSDVAGTSAAIATEAFSAADTVIIARDDDFADAMSATGLAGALNAPILLTNRQNLSPAASTTIDSLGATHAYIIGGAGAILPAVANALGAKGMTVERVYGSKAWDTSVACAQKISENGGSDEDVAIVTTSMSFQDAVSISSYAYAYKIPIFLQTQTGNRPLPDAAIQMIGLNSDTQIFALGGNGAVNPSTVEDVFGANRVTRLKGSTYYDTSNAIAEFMVDTNRLSSDTVTIASGAPSAKGVDALSGSALAGKVGGVMLLMNGNETSGEPVNYTTLYNFLRNHSSEVNKVYLLGGRVVMPESVEFMIMSILN